LSLSPYNYSIFFDFIESYLPTGFLSIHGDDPIMQRIEEVMEKNNQFLSVMHMEKIKYLFSSKRSNQVLGVEASQLNPAHFQSAAHPDDLDRLAWVSCQTLKEEGKIFRQKKGSALLSYTLRFRNGSGNFVNYLGQDYLFYAENPNDAVYLVRIITNVDWWKMKPDNYHQYVGKDLSLFRFPDEQLLKIAPVFSKRELEIIKLIESGLSSKEIAARLFLSIHTVNTHRTNILEKSTKAHLSDLIYELKEQGLV
jgi:hypothetical protein